MLFKWSRMRDSELGVERAGFKKGHMRMMMTDPATEMVGNGYRIWNGLRSGVALVVAIPAGSFARSTQPTSRTIVLPGLSALGTPL